MGREGIIIREGGGGLIRPFTVLFSTTVFFLITSPVSTNHANHFLNNVADVYSVGLVTFACF